MSATTGEYDCKHGIPFELDCVRCKDDVQPTFPRTLFAVLLENYDSTTVMGLFEQKEIAMAHAIKFLLERGWPRDSENISLCEWAVGVFVGEEELGRNVHIITVECDELIGTRRVLVDGQEYRGPVEVVA